MKPEEAEYVKLRMQRAHETLREAQALFEKGYLMGCVNRIYYACFYAVNAMLFSDSLSSSKHSGVRSLFERHWIKEGRFPVESGKFYRELFARRQEGDYQDTAEFEKHEVEAWLSETRSFIDLAADWLRDNKDISI